MLALNVQRQWKSGKGKAKMGVDAFMPQST